MTLRHAKAIADKGWRAALSDDRHLRAGLNVYDGSVTCRPVAEAMLHIIGQAQWKGAVAVLWDCLRGQD